MTGYPCCCNCQSESSAACGGAAAKPGIGLDVEQCDMSDLGASLRQREKPPLRAERLKRASRVRK